MVVVGRLAIEQPDLQGASNSSASNSSATSGSLRIDEFVIIAGKGFITEANGEGLFGFVGIKDEIFIKGDVDEGAGRVNNRRSGDAWSEMIRRGVKNRRGINRECKSGDGVITAVFNFAIWIYDYRWVVSDGDALIVIDI